MAKSKNLLMPIAYLGPVEYFAHIVSAEKIMLEKEEHYIKQTYRNRCNICTANGIQALSIPVIKINGNHTKIKDIQIDYSGKWQLEHWRAIVSGYSHAPFFLYYRDLLEPFYFRPVKSLFEFNLQLMENILQELEIDVRFSFTEYFVAKPDNAVDKRNAIHPKKISATHFPPYIQVFADKFGFIPNVSIIDLLFNEGPATVGYLKQLVP